MTGYGRRIQELRKENNMSVKDLADATEISVSSIQSYEGEYRKPSDEKKERIAEALHSTVPDIFFRPVPTN